MNTRCIPRNRRPCKQWLKVIVLAGATLVAWRTATADLDISILVQQNGQTKATRTQANTFTQPAATPRAVVPAPRTVAPAPRDTTSTTGASSKPRVPATRQTTSAPNGAGPLDAQSQYKLAQEFDAKGGANNLAQAAHWYAAAAQQGHANAQTSLGLMYAEGQGVGRSDETAAMWLERAANSDNPVAQYSLGLMHYEGRGVRRNHRTAFNWYERSARSGNAKAMNNLGVMTALGHGVAENGIMAYAWFSAAALAGDADAAVNRDLTADELDQNQRANALQEARKLQQQLGL